MDENILLSTKDLCAGYNKKQILHDISLEFERGKITVIAGENGCGKSTLLKSLIRIVPKTKGEIVVDGQNAETLTSVQLARKIAYLPQNKSIPDLTVMTMVLHGRFAHLSYPRRYRKEDLDAAQRALEITDLTEFADKKISHLSGGTAQRVFLAMTLAQSSPVILMDEPTSFMDISHQMKFMELCKNLANSGKAVVMVLHDLPAALKYADKIILMSQGKVISSGTPNQIFESGSLDRAFNVNFKRVHTDNGDIYYC